MPEWRNSSVARCITAAASGGILFFEPSRSASSFSFSVINHPSGSSHSSDALPWKRLRSQPTDAGQPVSPPLRRLCKRCAIRYISSQPFISARIVDIVGLGLNAPDTLIELPRFPASDSKLAYLSARTLPGGQTATAIVACAKWGLRTRYVGRIGDDAAGRMHREELARAGVESHLIRVQDCPSQQSFILVERHSGERTILCKCDPRLALRRGDLRRGWITSARLLQLDGHDTGAAAVAARWARSAGVLVCADLDTVYPGLPRLLRFVDYPVTSREF